MRDWEPIEKIDFGAPIWVIKYDMWYLGQEFVSANTPGATKFTDCHGYYTSFEDAEKVLRHFPKPHSYRVEKVYKRVLNHVS